MRRSEDCNMILLFEKKDGRTLAAKITQLTGIKVLFTVISMLGKKISLCLTIIKSSKDGCSRAINAHALYDVHCQLYAIIKLIYLVAAI
jgi:hypothetical protein